jgi:hypothetical protein
MTDNAYYIANRTKLLAQKKEYYKANKEYIIIKNKAYREANKEKLKITALSYRETHRKEIKAYLKHNKKKIKKYAKLYRMLNKEKREAYLDRSRDKRYSYNKKWKSQNYKTNPMFKLTCSIRTAIGKSLKGNKNGRHWELLVGYTLDKLKKHLENLFVDNMSWNNYGKDGWWIDHKIPVSVFNFTDPKHEDFKKCWALKNLQPMWAEENRSKSNKKNKHFQPSLLI